MAQGFDMIEILMRCVFAIPLEETKSEGEIFSVVESFCHIHKLTVIYPKRQSGGRLANQCTLQVFACQDYHVTFPDIALILEWNTVSKSKQAIPFNQNISRHACPSSGRGLLETSARRFNPLVLQMQKGISSHYCRHTF